MIFFCWFDDLGKDDESAVYVVAPDEGKALDCFKSLCLDPKDCPLIRMEQVEKITRPCGFLSWECWQKEKEALSGHVS